MAAITSSSSPPSLVAFVKIFGESNAAADSNWNRASGYHLTAFLITDSSWNENLMEYFHVCHMICIFGETYFVLFYSTHLIPWINK
jgi:hypothetical protein